MTNKPINTLRDGTLRATIWKNFGENGNFYTVNLSRTYKDEAGNYRDSDSFSGAELLRIARLATRAYDVIGEYRQVDYADLQNGVPA